MSISVEEFKKIQNFWRSREENSPLPRVPCSYFRRRTLIKSQTNHTDKVLAPVEENNDSNQEFNPETLSDKSELNNQLPENQAIEVPKLIENTCVEEGPTSNVLDTTEELELPSLLVADKNLDQESSDDECANGNLDQESSGDECANGNLDQESSVDECANGNLDQESSDDECANGNLDQESSGDECANGNLDQESSDDECANRQISPEFECENQLLRPATIANDSDLSSSNFEPFNYNAIPDQSGSSITTSTNEEDNNSEEDFFDDEWLLQKDHVFVLSFAAKPIFSLQKNGYENKMCNLFSLINCFINIFNVRKDKISSIEAEGIRFVFLVRNALYLVAASREDMSTYHLKIRLREVYNRIGFLLTFANLYYIFQNDPGYDLRRQLHGNYNLISNQLTSKIRVSNNIFTLFTNTIRILPLHPNSRSYITNFIKEKCFKIRSLVFALLIVDGQLVVLVQRRNHTIHSADIRLILNLMECSENVFKSYELSMLPVCLPNFNKDSYLYAYISCLSKECDAFFILLSYDRIMVEELSQAHCEITAALRTSKWFLNICQETKNLPQEGNGFNTGVINIPKLWHFLYIPKLSNNQLLCSKIIPPYTCLSEFKRLEAIYRDLHLRIHKKSRSLQLIFEVKEKEVAVALEKDKAEIYAVFDPLVNTHALASYYIDELFRWISSEQKAYFIRSYPKFH